MQPYWRSDDGRHVLYCGDCLAVLPHVGRVDAVVTDPPYLGMKGGTVFDHAGVAPRINTSWTVGNELGSADALPLLRDVATKAAVVFCSFHWLDQCAAMIGGERKCLVSWYKRNTPYSVQNAPWHMTEYAWAVQYAPGIDWRNLRTHIDAPNLQAGCMAVERICNNGRAAHPAQKPVAVIEAVLCPGMDLICDPYAGTGTTMVAAHRTGRRSIGIEIEPKYCEIAKRRMERELAQPFLPGMEPHAETRQAELFEVSA